MLYCVFIDFKKRLTLLIDDFRVLNFQRLR